MNINTILDAYIQCALWSSTGEDGEPIEGDLSEETKVEMREDVGDFVTSNMEDLEKSGLSESQIGHDFWLTRNGNGAGFWDRGLGSIGDKLSDACKPYGSVDLYVGDDGRIYQ